MKNWTKPEVIEFEVSMTASGCYDWEYETCFSNDKEKRTES